ncbi:hypothetical protein, partial [Thioclava sp. UBA3469]|uniref:hypothetical protein n=1 Tax=Thioclava sp. UBA3469 TaxID=1947693 RepID=UPI00257BAD83
RDLTVDDPQGGTISAKAFSFSIDGAYVFVGAGGEFSYDEFDRVDAVANAGTGFAAEGLAFDLISVTEVVDLQANPSAVARSWTAMSAHADTISPRGLPQGLELTVNSLDFTLNGRDATNSDQLDWAPIIQDLGVDAVAPEAGTDLVISGGLDLDIFGFVTGSATFDIVMRNQIEAELDSTSDGLENASLMLIGLHVENLFV